MADVDYENDQRGYADEPAYPRERSRSPRADRDGDIRIRSASPNGRDDRGPPPASRGDDESINPGSNLFVTGIHPSLSEDEIQRLFEKYGEVEKCNIMRDPHTKESRGFGFVKMVTAEQADAAKNGLQGEVYEGRTLSIEKARRAKPRTPTPGKYFGPRKEMTALAVATEEVTATETATMIADTVADVTTMAEAAATATATTTVVTEDVVTVTSTVDTVEVAKTATAAVVKTAVEATAMTAHLVTLQLAATVALVALAALVPTQPLVVVAVVTRTAALTGMNVVRN
ncbi:hypothetical protein H2203_009023 [Taxawa tesnikishii (nom. ined.)]|nr:hypothetical protein H2203_009023 [Dothideales sp. JES 119]